MAILKFIERVCVQTVVYWEYDGPDGFGGVDLLPAVERRVRWDESTEIVSDNDGKEFLSKAQVLTPDDMKEQSYLYLGELSDLGVSPMPGDIENAYEIKKMDRHPLFKSTTLDVFIAYLG